MSVETAALSVMSVPSASYPLGAPRTAGGDGRPRATADPPTDPQSGRVDASAQIDIISGTNRGAVNPFHCPVPPPPPPIMIESGASLGGALFTQSRRRSAGLSPHKGGGSAAATPRFHVVNTRLHATSTKKKDAPRPAGGLADTCNTSSRSCGAMTSSSPPLQRVSSSPHSKKQLATGAASSSALIGSGVSSKVFLERRYYGGIYYVPPASIRIDRTLTALDTIIQRNDPALLRPALPAVSASGRRANLTMEEPQGAAACASGKLVTPPAAAIGNVPFVTPLGRGTNGQRAFAPLESATGNVADKVASVPLPDSLLHSIDTRRGGKSRVAVAAQDDALM